MASSIEECQAVNISDFSQYFDIPSVSDISGTGVLIGFLVPAYVLLGIVCIYYIVTYDPALDPYRQEKVVSKCTRPNPFDQLILGFIRKPFRILNPRRRQVYISEALQDAFDKCVLSMADVQVFTGLSSLISGYVARKGLSALHWKMIVYLAWFSCTTHLSALVFLRNYLINHHAKRWWRLFSMFVLLVALIVAMIPTGHFAWEILIYIWDVESQSEPIDSDDLERYAAYIDAPPSANATCYFNTNFGSNPSYQGKNAMLTSMLLLSLSFTARIFKLHPKLFGFKIQSSSNHLVKKVVSSAQIFQKFFGITTFQDRVVSNIIVSAHMTVCVWIDLYTSMAIDVYLLMVSLAWGTIKIVGLLRISGKSPHRDDDTWSFGQVLPVLLLVLPLISIVEHFLKSISKVRNQATEEARHEYTMVEIPQTIIPTSTRAPTTWIIKPELLDEYYQDSIGMPWLVTICNGYNIMTAIMILLPYAIDKLNLVTPIDTLAQAQSLAIWYIFSQGATIHMFILMFTFIEAKWKRQLITHLALGLIAGGLLLASVYICLSVRSGRDETYFHKYGVPMYYIATTLGGFIISLVVRQFLNWLQARRRKSPRDESREIPL